MATASPSGAEAAAVAEPITAQPSAASSSTTDPAAAGPSTSDPSAIDQSTAGPSTAGPSTAGPSTAGPSTAGPSTAGPSGADPSKAGTSEAGQSEEEKAATKPSPTPRRKKQLYGREGIRKPRNEDGQEEESSDEEIDIHNIVPDDPLFHGFGSESIGNMPELTTLLQDDEILQKFQDEKTMDLLRRIALDTSKIEDVLNERHPEIEFLSTKIKAVFKKSRDERQEITNRTKKREQERVDRVKAERKAARKAAAGQTTK